ncbi:hypothetical protein ACSL103130_11850 [Actinomyces slackii]|uniref:Uncharacterized protein n=1 Tax=Actinomyces slackii TaxID=52774 RepID=A0A3S4SM25_9ACTO|nr:hypothetical protein [Actinomyces slackii]VEG75967.1 Uncharacterised protein [Actinomyces slackii]
MSAPSDEAEGATEAPEPAPSANVTQPPRRHLLAWLAGGSAIAIGGGLLWAYRPGGYFTRDAIDLRALRADPMSNTTLLGLRAIEVQDSTPAGWFAVQAPRMRLNRWFRDDNSTPHDLQSRLITHAKKQGWEWAEDSDSAVPSIWIGRRSSPSTDTDMSLTISISPADSPSDQHYNTVRISLGFF